MRFEFATATRIIFGESTAATLPDLARTFGTRPLVVTGSSRERARALVSALSAETFAVSGEPTVDLVREGARQARDAACDVVISIGGGSVIDAGKAIAIIATNGGEPLEFLETVGKGRTITVPPLPFIAVPTTAGTGSEVTRNAVLGSTEHGVKASLRSPLMIERIAGALRRAYHNGADRDARHDMALASLFGGLALANAGLGVVHGFAAPLGGQWKAPHCTASVPSYSVEIKLVKPTRTRTWNQGIMSALL